MVCENHHYNNLTKYEIGKLIMKKIVILAFILLSAAYGGQEPSTTIPTTTMPRLEELDRVVNNSLLEEIVPFEEIMNNFEACQHNPSPQERHRIVMDLTYLMVKEKSIPDQKKAIEIAESLNAPILKGRLEKYFQGDYCGIGDFDRLSQESTRSIMEMFVERASAQDLQNLSGISKDFNYHFLWALPVNLDIFGVSHDGTPHRGLPCEILRDEKILTQVVQFFPTIRSLKLEWLVITGAGLESLKPLNNYLRQLSLQCLDEIKEGRVSMAKGKELKHVRGLTQLTDLDFGGLECTEGWEVLQALTNLNRLNLGGVCEIRSTDLTSLMSLTNLTSLFLPYCSRYESWDPDHNIEKLKAAMPNIKIRWH